MAIHEAKRDNKWSGTTTTRLHHGNHHSAHPRRGPWHHHHGPSHATLTFKGLTPRRASLCRLNLTRAQCVAKPSLSLTPTRRVARSHSPTCSHQAAHSRGLACFYGPPCSCGLPSSPNWSKISSTISVLNFRTDDRTGSILTTFFCGFDISQLKSCARSLPHFHCSRRYIHSMLFQPTWRTTLVSTSHRVEERPRTSDDLSEPALAAQRDATCPR
ncbi:hypothetical protein TB1_012960 [Malus domestica]